MPLLAPVQYPVRSTSPTRIGGFDDAPFRIINLGTVTVWVSRNAGLSPGVGTPIYAGTSLQWLAPTEVWAIGEGNGIVLVTTEIDDWQGDANALAGDIALEIYQQGITLVDNPVILQSGNFTGPGAIPQIDISKYQSLNIIVQLVTAATPSTADNAIEFRFVESTSNNVIRRVPLVFITAGHWWGASVPCSGNRLSIAVPNNSQFLVSVSGSQRPVSRVQQRVDCFSVAEVAQTDLLFETVNLVGVNSVGTFDLSPWHGRVAVDTFLTVSPAVALGTSNVSLYQRTGGNVVRLAVIPLNPTSGTATTAWANTEFQYNGGAMRATITNSTTSTLAGVIRVTPVTGALV